MGNFKVLLKKNLLEMFRSKKIFVFSAVFVALVVISALSARYLPSLISELLDELESMTGQGLFVFSSTVADSYVQFISNFVEIGLLLVGLMFAGVIVKEKSKGTYDSLKMNGVKDKDIILSHFVSQVIVVSLSYFISVALFAVLNIILFRQIMGLRGIVALSYIYLLLILMICFSLFVSCLCKKRGKAYLLVILGYFLLGFLEMLPKINLFNPFHLSTLSTDLMYYENYLLSEHITTVLFSLFICAVMVVFALLLVGNKINNRKVSYNDNREGI